MSARSARPSAVWFDLYGTLVDLAPLADICAVAAAGRGPELAARWRQHQLEASWLRSMAGAWEPFDVVTTQSLAVAAAELDVDPGRLAALEGAFERLPRRPEAVGLLEILRRGGVVVGVLSNGSTSMIRATLRQADLAHLIDTVRSAEDVRRYKPDPAVYQLAVDATAAPPDEVGFVTTNGWDAAGAATFGLSVAWLPQAPDAVLPAVGAPPLRPLDWSDLSARFGLDG